ncbi:MAG: response regulator transcription factor [Chloroflexi bacterium]|nr:response regulator transcription factor [Chloroflexota bacterium]
MAPSRPINVLIVDDDVNARARVRNVLGATDVDVVVREAADGIAAVHGLRGDRPDLLVLDLQMPELDGLGVLRLLRDWPADLKPHFIAVVSTCKIDPWMTAGVRLLGADAVYPKPLLCADAERILDSLGERASRAA